MLKQKATIGLIASVLLVITPFLLAADESIDKMLDEEQQKLQAELEHSLVAPCCWNMTVDQHESPASREVRQKIAEMIKDGKSRDEIISYFVSQTQYGERILATPSQDNLLGKAAYWLIPLALIFGIFVVTKTIRSLTTKSATEKSASQTSQSHDTGAANSWDKKVEEELKQYD